MCTDFSRLTGSGRAQKAAARAFGLPAAPGRGAAAPRPAAEAKGPAAAGQAPATAAEAEELLPCPPDAGELGAATWTFLHTMAAHYPRRPDAAQQAHAQALLQALGALYPCSYCAAHLREDLPAHPPRLESREALSAWMCALHNRVNERTGKPAFDCARVMERWRRSASRNPNC